MSAIQIVIPMSGFGERFRQAGYTVPKPLIEIDGKPIIGHVIEMFPGETELLFICNQDHLNEPAYRMEAIIRAHCPSARIVGIPSHKLGPVHAVQQAAHLLDPARPVLVSYCDYTCYWDWQDFKRFVAETGCDGAIPAYRGFHPHSLGTTNYAYLRDHDGWALDIKEKEPFTSNRMQEFASSGAYYFATAALMFDTFSLTVAQGLSVNDEYYVSLAYKPLMAQQRAIAIYELQHFMQWGTPQDVTEYQQWSRIFKLLAAPQPPRTAPRGSIVLPMAGLGQRFAQEGYAQPKPLIPVSGEPMVLQATADLPPATQHAFVLRRDMPGHDDIATELRAHYPAAKLVTITEVTEGQACTALIGLDALDACLGTAPGPLTIGACDSGALYDARALQALIDRTEVDVIVWVARGHADALRRPTMFGWVAETGGRIDRVSVKQALASPQTDPIVTGTFTFRRSADLHAAVERLIARNGRVNGEFYLDSCIDDCIAMSLNCQVFEIDALLSWGTPNDLRSFEYWQSCFHKWPSHCYRLEQDARVNEAARQPLEARYSARHPVRPAGRPAYRNGAS